MQPEIESLISKNQLEIFNKQVLPEIIKFIQAENIDDSFLQSLTGVYLPLSKWIFNKQSSASIVIGINGAQGSGKSTLCKLLKLILEKLFHKTVCHLSIDDLYLSRKDRLQLADTIHPLLKTRGVPGTHNAQLGIDIIKQLKQMPGQPLKIPVFDKSKDDLLPENKWKTLQAPVDIILFEGWCVAAKPQTKAELNKAVNKLEKTSDENIQWRSYVNSQLSGIYAELFSHIDYLVMLQVPDFNSVLEWRNLQEKKLAAESNGMHIMSAAEIRAFIIYFERITRACLKEMPDRADVLLTINKKHQIDRMKLK